MGRDKAILEVAGRSALAVVAADALRHAGAAPVVAVGGDGSALAALGLEVVPDDHPGEGPLGGILTALRATRAAVVVVLACDMPDIDAGTVGALVAGLAATPEADVALAVAGGRIQPLTGAYRQRAGAALAEAFEAGERSVRAALRRLTVAEVTGLRADALRDVDRPADLRRYAHPS